MMARLWFLSATLLSFQLIAGPTTVGPLVPTYIAMPERVIAVGDIHGDCRALHTVLHKAGVVDAEFRWVAKNLVVVQVGDLVDRWVEDAKVIARAQQLEIEARDAGGRFYVLNGNHELMNVDGDFRHVSEQGFREFDQYRAAGIELVNGSLAFSHDEAGRHYAFRPAGPVAQWLATHPTILVFGSRFVAVHAGLNLRYANYGVEWINYELSQFLMGKWRRPGWIDDDENPLWTKTMGRDLIPWTRQELRAVLALLQVDLMVVGHTPQRAGITLDDGNALWRIDTAMSRGMNGTPLFQALEITPDSVRAIGDR